MSGLPRQFGLMKEHGLCSILLHWSNYPEGELSNNLAENSMRSVALGRTNWIHPGSAQAGPKVAAIVSVIGSSSARVSPQRVSALTRRKSSRFSFDTLVNRLTRAGLEIDVRIKPALRVA